MQVTKYLLREFWAIFVDDRSFHSDSLHEHEHVLSKAVLSCATTVMDGQGKMDGFKISGMHVDLHQDGADKVAVAHTRNVRVPAAKWMLSIILCVNWVWAGTFDDHEWVSESAIAEQEEEVMGRDVDYEICIPSVVQWSMLWVFRAHAVESNFGRRRNKHRTIPRSCEHGDCRSDVYASGSHTPRTCMLTTVAAVLHKTHRKWGVNKEMNGWRMEGRPSALC